jgi:hypothetical protein
MAETAADGRAMLGIDGRRTTAKRFRELVAAFAYDLGGEASLTAAELALIRQAAVVTVAAEQMQTELLNGGAIATDDLVRSTNAVTRILVALGATRRKRGPAHVPMRERFGGGK